MPRPFLDTSPGFFERSFHFNVTTAFVLSKAATPHLLASGAGSIVNISSAIGRLRDRGFVAYGTAKAALSHMTRLTAADLAPKVRVNAIAVGSIATSALEIVLDNPEIHDEMVRRTPLEAARPARGHRAVRALPRVAGGQLRHRQAVRGRRRARRGQPRDGSPRPHVAKPANTGHAHAPLRYVSVPTVADALGVGFRGRQPSRRSWISSGRAKPLSPRPHGHGGDDGGDRDRSVHVRELARERVRRRFPAQLARQARRARCTAKRDRGCRGRTSRRRDSPASAASSG